MKKILGIFAAMALFGLVFTGCASKEAAPAAAAEPAVEAPVAPTEAVELVYGVDYILEPVFGTELYAVDETTITFYEGCANNNHAVLFRLLDPASVLFKDCTIDIEYTMNNYDPAKSCQVCIQPADDKGADYGNQNYPILYNNFEENANVLTIDLNKILKSSVKKTAVGFRIVCNNGSYDKYTWQDNWGFTINKVTLNPPAF